MLFPAADVKPVFDAVTVEDVGHPDITVQANVPVGSTESDLHMAETPTLLIGHKIDGVVEIHRIIIKTIEKTSDIEHPAHADQVSNLVGVAEGEISGMKTAETTTCDADLAYLTFIADVRYQLILRNLSY